MITLKTITNAGLRETTVAAYDAKGEYICSETWSGTGGRVQVALTAHVRTSAEQQQRRQLLAAGSSTQQTRLMGARV
jgi:hypothetical protein